MQFATGCWEDTSKTCEEKLTRDELNKCLPLSASMPCPIENMRYFATMANIVSRENTAKCYLVDIENGRTTTVRIYLISDREGLDRVHRWLLHNGKKLQERSNVAMLPQVLPWHNELLQYDINGGAVSCIADYAERDEYKRLVTIFRESGSQVDTLPGRKPPLVQGRDGQFSIEWIVNEEK